MPDKTMIRALLLLAILFAPARAWTEREVHPGENIQSVVDRAAPHDRIVLLPGEHLTRIGRYRSMLYVGKPLDIELRDGAILKLAANQAKLEKTPEITTDHGPRKTIDDLEAGGNYDLGLGAVIYTISIDSSGKNGAQDTFRWGAGREFDYQHEHVPITGEWQDLNHGVKIRFPHRSGHASGSLWFISYDGPETYGIRIGYGLQPEYIDGVHIAGRGTIDLNSAHNAQPSDFVKNINACVLIHGRVRNVVVEGITMMNTMRSVMAYGEHTGKFLQGGGVTPGESFDAENVTIRHTRTINPNGSGYLLGHPSHRGWLRNVICNDNYMETAKTAIEPNFQLDHYEVTGNIIKSAGRAVHCWRKSTNGLVADNVRIEDTTGLEVVIVNAPAAWERPENITVRNNRNLLSGSTGCRSKASAAGDSKKGS